MNLPDEASPQVPRSAFDLTGGIVYFARMLDKIRLQAAASPTARIS
jgi:hypothetical protein